MKKNFTSLPGNQYTYLAKILMIMKLTYFLMFFKLLTVSAIGLSQAERVTVKLTDASLKELVNTIEEQTQYKFLYRDDELEGLQVNMNVVNFPLDQVLNQSLEGSDFDYRILENNLIVITSHENLQQQRITGTVTDRSGNPLPGVSVVAKGTTTGTVTDADGKFSLDRPAEAKILTFSFVGMVSQEVEIGAQAFFNIVLAEAELELDEVIVIGYGTMKKVNLTGSISQVSSEKLENRPVTNALAALQGTASGVLVTRNTGQPGKEGYDVEIRGLSSVNGGNALVLVDGAPGDISTLNPNDIESVNILKDAAASAIYGARAAGGVILVTTKKGVAGKLTLEYNGLYGYQKPMMLPERLPSWEETWLVEIARLNAGLSRDITDQEIEWMKDPEVEYVDAWWNSGVDYRMLYDMNQIPIVCRDFSPTYDHNISMRGGNDREQFFMSLGYYHQQGIFKFGPDETNRINARLNYARDLSKVFSTDIKLSYRQSNTLSPTMSVDGKNALFDQLFRYRLSYPIFLPESNDTKYYYFSSNPRVYPILKDGGEVKNRGDEFTGVFTLKARDIIKGLTISTIYSPRYLGGITNGNYRTVEMWNRVRVGGRLNYPNSASRNRSTSFSNNIQLLADYDFNIGEKNIFHILGGYAYEDYRYHYISATAKSLSSNDLFTLTIGDPTLNGVSEKIETWALLSCFGRIDYNFNNRFLLEANLRYDGSSKLSPDNRWELFPSLSGAWRIENENWFKELLPFIDQFKLRASWGQLGNSDGVIGNYDYIGIISTGINALFNNVKNTSYYQAYLASEDKTWETIQTSNVGLDLSVLRNRLSVSGDYFIKRNNNMLAPLQVSSMIGITTSTYNVADMKTWGWEVTVGWRDSPSDSFNYWANLNVFDAQNKILKYDGRSAIAAGTNSIIEGMPYNSIFGYVADGYFTSSEEVASSAFQNNKTGVGDIKYRDLNGDEKINEGSSSIDDHGDLVYLGNPSPRYNFGIDFGFKWRGFDFSAFFQGVAKRKMLLDASVVYPFKDTGRMPSTIHRDYWTLENPDAKFPRPYYRGTHNTVVSSHWIQDCAYIRLKNLQVGYTLPQSLTERVAISNARIYFSGQDIWEKTKMWYKFYDPENPNNTTFIYPLFRTFTMGVTITF